MNKTAIALLALLASSASLAATPWQKITQPVPGSAQSIGSFSNGCIVGADTLPIQSEHYQVMRTDQRRYFGHPDLVMFIQRLSSQVSNLLVVVSTAVTPATRPDWMSISSCNCRKHAGPPRSSCARKR